MLAGRLSRSFPLRNRFSRFFYVKPLFFRLRWKTYMLTGLSSGVFRKSGIAIAILLYKFRGAFAFLEGLLYVNGTHAPVNSRKIGNRRFFTSVPFGIRRRPTLPGRFQPSTISAKRLNFCVRDGYRWFPLAIITGNLYSVVVASLFRFPRSFPCVRSVSALLFHTLKTAQ